MITLVHKMVHLMPSGRINKGSGHGFESHYLHMMKSPVNPRKASNSKGSRDFRFAQMCHIWHKKCHF